MDKKNHRQKQKRRKEQPKQNSQSNTKPKRKKREIKKLTQETHRIFPNDFEHVAYLMILYEKLISTTHLRYWNYVIC